VLNRAWFLSHSGFGMQRRYVLPLLALVPLTAGEIVAGHARRLRVAGRQRLVVGVALAVIAGLQAYAGWFDANAVSGGGAYVPPTGWVAWAAVLMLGVSALLTVALTEALRARRPVTG
jgi:hypothetical protein